MPACAATRPEELLAPLVERHDALLDVGGREELLLRVALLVDELDDADDLVLARGERRDEHPLRAVADLLVERAIEAERRAGGHVVHVVDVERLLLERGVAGDAARADGHRELARVERERIVLRELEAQRAMSDARVVALDDVDAAGVGAGDEAALLEDEAEQLVDVALGRDRARDVDELAELVAVAVQPLAAALAPRLRVHELEGLVEGDEELVVRRLGRQNRREAEVQRLGRDPDRAACRAGRAALRRPRAFPSTVRRARACRSHTLAGASTIAEHPGGERARRAGARGAPCRRSRPGACKSSLSTRSSPASGGLGSGTQRLAPVRPRSVASVTVCLRAAALRARRALRRRR